MTHLAKIWHSVTASAVVHWHYLPMCCFVFQYFSLLSLPFIAQPERKKSSQGNSPNTNAQRERRKPMTTSKSTFLLHFRPRLVPTHFLFLKTKSKELMFTIVPEFKVSMAYRMPKVAEHFKSFRSLVKDVYYTEYYHSFAQVTGRFFVKYIKQRRMTSTINDYDKPVASEPQCTSFQTYA